MLLDKQRLICFLLAAVSLFLLLFVPNLTVNANWSSFRSEIENALDSLTMMAKWYGVTVDSGSIKQINRAISDGKLTGADSLVVSHRAAKLIHAVSRAVSSSDDLDTVRFWLTLFCIFFVVTAACGIAAAVFIALGKKSPLPVIYASLTFLLFALYLFIYIKITDEYRVSLGFVYAPLLTFLTALAAPVCAPIIKRYASSLTGSVRITGSAGEYLGKAKAAIEKGCSAVAGKGRGLGKDLRAKLADRPEGKKPLFRSGPAPQEYRYCPECGCRIGSRDRFCGHCGHKQ